MFDKLLLRIKIRVKNLLSPSGLVTPNVSKDTWEEQYSSGVWDYLEGDEEKEHYHVIVDYVKKYGVGDSVFDLGCGKGVLYNYLKQSDVLNDKQYYGVDISENAIKSAEDTFDKELFGVLDYQHEHTDRQFGCVIFNETLYYFNDIDKILQKCFRENVNENGVLIISMVKYGKHHLIWELIDKHYNVLDARTVKNSKGNEWTIKVISKFNG